jgi:hypothetical protein
MVAMQVLHRHHTAKKASMHLPRNSTDIIMMPLSFVPFMRSLSTLCITNLELAGKATCESLQRGVSSSDADMPSDTYRNAPSDTFLHVACFLPSFIRHPYTLKTKHFMLF